MAFKTKSIQKKKGIPTKRDGLKPLRALGLKQSLKSCEISLLPLLCGGDIVETNPDVVDVEQRQAVGVFNIENLSGYKDCVFTI
jgi:hypothetical protein